MLRALNNMGIANDCLYRLARSTLGSHLKRFWNSALSSYPAFFFQRSLILRILHFVCERNPSNRARFYG